MDDAATNDRTERFGETTSLHVQRARDGDEDSLAYLYARFHPLVLLQARKRYSPLLRCSVEDLAQDTWVRALPLLARLDPKDGRHVEALIRTLGTVLWRRCRDLMTLRSSSRSESIENQTVFTFPRPLEELVVTDEVARVCAEIDRLDGMDRDILIIHLIEGRPFREAGEALDVSENTATQRYRRALRRLRERLPDSVFEHLSDPAADQDGATPS